MHTLAATTRQSALPDMTDFHAVLFDLDGVITPTAEVHMRAWAALFQPFLADQGSPRPYTEQDYFAHIDGKQRYEGVAALLASRGIELPWGDPGDPPDANTVCGLGNRKNVVFNRVLAEEGVEPYRGSTELIERLEEAGTRMAIVSSSRNARAVLDAAGLGDRFEVVVDGEYAAAEGLPGKPDPATYLRAAQLLGVEPELAVVVEDALSGVEAGQRGDFGLVVGVDRGAGADELLAAGADVVVEDLAEMVAAVDPSLMDRRRHPIDAWRFIERNVEPRDRPAYTETLFALGNGYLGLRGNDEEGGEAYEHGTFINGFHETWPIEYPESAYGLAEVGQTIVNLPDAKTVQLQVGEEALDLALSRVAGYERVLDMRTGTLERSLTWHTQAAGRVEVRSRRMVSFEHKHLAVITYSVTPLDDDVELTLRSLLIDRQTETGPLGTTTEAGAEALAEGAEFDPRRGEDLSGALTPALHGVTEEGERLYLAHNTLASRLSVAVMASHSLQGGEAEKSFSLSPRRAEASFVVRAQRGRTVTLTKLVAYHDGDVTQIDELLSAAERTLQRAEAVGADGLYAEQRAWLEAVWQDADVLVPGQPAVQQAVRWNLFQLLQATAKADGRGVSAKGVTGSGYSGHYFWDTEIYVLPYLIHTWPEAARNALLLRHSMLPAARRRAETMSEEGALFPWRTINGEEASAYYPAGTAQYHINADVAYAVAKYVMATDDQVFMRDYGAEILVETARLWRSLGYMKPSTGRFHINAVTGPDEYSAVVDDNFYTNVMAAFNLRLAADTLERLELSAPEEHARLADRLALAPDEPQKWRETAEKMELPYDEELGIHLQDARWLEREPWDLAATPPEKRPLLLHYHPLVIYRHRVLKQADLVLALYLHSRLFTLEEKRRDFDHYDPLTTGDSSLSAAVQSIIAAEVGYPELAMEHFEQMLYTDLADLHANAADGVHVAAAGGAWQALVAGFGGMREDGGMLRFDPRLPAGWRELGFVVRTGGSKIRVRLRHNSATFTLTEGEAAELELRGRPVRLMGSEPVTVEF